MAKEKFHYDASTLSYVKVEVKTSEKIKRFLFAITAIGLIAFLGYIGFSQVFESPREKEYKRELDNMTLHYDLLNKKMNQVSSVLDELAERDNNIYRVYFEANPIPN